jgi:hypothetical protein
VRELPVGALIDDHFVAVLASRRAPGPDGDDIVLDVRNGLGPSGGSGAASPHRRAACPAKPTLPTAVATTGLMPVTRAARDASTMSILPARLKLRVARTAARAGHPVPVRRRRPTK